MDQWECSPKFEEAGRKVLFSCCVVWWSVYIMKRRKGWTCAVYLFQRHHSLLCLRYNYFYWLFLPLNNAIKWWYFKLFPQAVAHIIAHIAHISLSRRGIIGLAETFQVQDHTSQDHFCSMFDEFPVWSSETNPAAMMWIVPFPEREKAMQHIAVSHRWSPDLDEWLPERCNLWYTFPPERGLRGRRPLLTKIMRSSCLRLKQS